MPYCIVNAGAGYAYVNVAKAACTSIKLAIAEHAGVDFETLQWNRPWRMTLTQLVFRHPDAYAFTFIRHPAARLVSCWADWCCEPLPSEENFDKNPRMREFIGWDFEQFVRRVCEMNDYEMNHHFAPQRHAICCMGHVIPEVFHVETMGRDWRELRMRFGLPTLRHARKSTHKPWRSYYTPEALAMVEERFACDYELGKYEMQECRTQ